MTVAWLWVLWYPEVGMLAVMLPVALVLGPWTMGPWPVERRDRQP